MKFIVVTFPKFCQILQIFKNFQKFCKNFPKWSYCENLRRIRPLEAKLWSFEFYCSNFSKILQNFANFQKFCKNFPKWSNCENLRRIGLLEAKLWPFEVYCSNFSENLQNFANFEKFWKILKELSKMVLLWKFEKDRTVRSKVMAVWILL